MKLSANTLQGVSRFLECAIGDSVDEGGNKLAVSVLSVLGHGNRKHALDEQTAAEHTEAALRHLTQNGNDSDTGQPHEAHAAARLILAVLALAQKAGNATGIDPGYVPPRDSAQAESMTPQRIDNFLREQKFASACAALGNTLYPATGRREDIN